MHYLSNICALCLVSTQNLKNILSVDNDGVVVEQKLRAFLSELVNFKPDIHKYVCNTCLEYANSIYKFKLMCLKNMGALSDFLSKLDEPGQGKNIKFETDHEEDTKNQFHTQTKLNLQINDETNVNETEKSTTQTNFIEHNENKINTPVAVFIKTEIEDIEIEESYSPFKEDVGETSNETSIKNESQASFKISQSPYEAFKEFNEVKYIDGDETASSFLESAPAPPKRYSCPTCHKCFQYRSYLKKHLRIHTNERPYQCPECHKTFKQSQHLITHKRTHTGEKPYSCEICHKTFNNGGNITNHMRIHTGVKPYHCQLCQYKCIKAGDLKRHMMGHTGERPYECKVCQRRFTQSAHLKDHIQTHSLLERCSVSS